MNEPAHELRVPIADLDGTDPLEFLAAAELEVLGRMPWSSNGTFLVVARHDDVETAAIYKPQRGERPLWDFPDGTLFCREVAAFVVSEALGWGIVPPTVRRKGPLGEGMVQLFVEHDADEHYFTMLEEHAERFRDIAIFDVLANNADRKGGHCLQDLQHGTIFGIDHGLTFHEEWKLRTVIWDFAGERITDARLAAVQEVRNALDTELGEQLGVLLSSAELDALRDRTDGLLVEQTYPIAEGDWRSVPWPMV